jgi:hypothetical protein
MFGLAEGRVSKTEDKLILEPKSRHGSLLPSAVRLLLRLVPTIESH